MPTLSPTLPGGKSLVKDNMHLLSYQVDFTDGDKKAGIEIVDAVLLPNYCTADVIRVQDSHNVQTGTTTGGFH